MGWDLGVPNLGGGYLYDALSKAGDNFDKVASGVGGLIQRGRTADQTLAALHQSGQLPDNVYQSVLGKGIGAKEQMLGMYGGAISDKLKSYNTAAGQYQAMKDAGVPMFNPSLLNQFPAGQNGQTPNQQPLPGTPGPNVGNNPTVQRAQPMVTPSANAQNIPQSNATTGPAVFTPVLKDPATGKMAKYPIVNGAPDFTKPAFQ